MDLSAAPSEPRARSRSSSPLRAGSPPTSEPSLPLPQAYTLMSSFNSFLTVAIHNILYYRGIYPQRTFMSVRAFNLPVHQNRHPAVCSWVHDAVDAAIAQIADGAAQRIGVVIHAPAVKPLPANNVPDKAAAIAAPTTPGQKPGPKPPPGTMGPPPLPAKRAIAISTGKVSRPATQPSPATTRTVQTTIAATSPATTKTTPGVDTDSPRPAMPPPPKPGAVLERWMFDVSEFPAWPGGAEALANFGVDDPKKKPNKKKGDGNEGDGDAGRNAEGADGRDGEEDDEDDDSESGEEAAEFTDSDDEQENDQEGDEEQRLAFDREPKLASVPPEDEINWVDVNEHLRGAVKRLANAGEQLARLPEGCTFTIAVELRDNARPPLKVRHHNSPQNLALYANLKPPAPPSLDPNAVKLAAAIKEKAEAWPRGWCCQNNGCSLR
ncbi:uncharacterized protein PgNI_03799 [Pyricularia grisea]|uniref:HORMA domain-containing protein n=1 Tax=Pyricularia grisea TaxID=148305 RepID=A0A6P8BDA1_PYRGI|nr:uncharacterized protein PgNI_03799 [Pyricularia grisea]TLD13739.1 hypothetical protein PgNI_03799 [Pyricularia grisea]